MHTASGSAARRTALDFDRATLDLSSPRDGLIFDLQNADEVLTNHGQSLSYLRRSCRDLIESGVWNATELQRLLDSAPASAHAYHAELRRSLLSRFDGAPVAQCSEPDIGEQEHRGF